MPQRASPAPSLPFQIYEAQLQMLSCTLKNGCEMSRMLLDMSSQLDGLASEITPHAFPPLPQFGDMFPSVEGMQSVTTTLAKAMNEAAIRTVSHAAGKHEEDEADNAAVPAQPARKYKPSISAAKKQPTKRA